MKARLGLTLIRKELLNLNVFGSETTRKQSCDVVKVRLQGWWNKDTALGFSTVEWLQYPQLQELELANYTQSIEEDKGEFNN